MTAPINPEKLGKKIGNIVNGLPETPSDREIQAASDLARLFVAETIEPFDEVVVPEEIEWGLPGSEHDSF